MKFPSIYLASGSPRRSEILTQIDVNFSTLSVDVDESQFEGETPIEYVQRVAIAKAQAGWDILDEKNQLPVLGADTSVVLDNDVLGKPKDDIDARIMLKRLSGTKHQVLTAVAIVFKQQILCELNINEVVFATLTETEIDWYVSTHEGSDKAGSYAVQGLAALFIKQIQGSYSGIMGLPIRETGELLKRVVQ